MSLGMRTFLRSLALAALCSALAAPAASAAVRLGPDISAAPGGNTGCGGSDCTLVNLAAPGLTFAAPFTGVLVRWRIQTAGATADWRLRTVRGPVVNTWIATGTGAFESVVPGAERSFATRLKIQAGDLIGIDGPPSGTAPLTTASGGNFSSFHPPLLEGAAPQAPDTNGAGFIGKFNADLEADADGDGFGDETQDLCPVDARTQAPCLCRGTPATINGTAGRDVLRGTPGRDVMVGGSGRDKISGRGGGDFICGGTGRDLLKGGGGKDRLFGEAGRDTLLGGPGRDRLRGGPGRDAQKP
jgi:hypothetical protein